MLDLKFITEHPEQVRQALQNRRADLSIDDILTLNSERKNLQQEFDTARAKQNQASQQIVQLKKTKQDASALLSEMQALSVRLKDISQQQTETEAALNELLMGIPNIPQDSVPVGRGADENVEVRAWGEKRSFDFTPKEHSELGENLGLLDFERAAKITGARFALYRGALAKLERALIHFMLETHTREHGYEEILPPFMVNAASLRGTGQLPKFEQDLFKTTFDYFLIPTAEVPVTNIHRDEILVRENLPLKFCAYTPCFRSEAGSHGKDVKGLIRQHQFNKVELVKITTPEQSAVELESLTRDAEVILQKLELPYRTMILCTGDMGFGSAKTYDIEVWLPGQGAYREISSCSNFEAFQARRMNTRFRVNAGKPEFVHTLNGSGLAVGRTLVAILENYQQADGSILIPKVLQNFMGTERIVKKTSLA